MRVPTEGPLGVEMLAHIDGGAFLTVEEEAPFWMFWKTHRRVTILLDKFGMIWLYQACAKLMRRGVMEQGFDELRYDLQASLAASEANIANRVSMNDDVLEEVAQLLRQKGWVKM